MAGQPTFVQKKSSSNTAVSSLVVTPGSATTAGNTLLLAIALDANIDFTLGGVVDSEGNDAFGVPLNTWTPLGNTSAGGLDLWWYACRGALSVTTVTAIFTGATNAIATLLEYSGVNGIGAPQFQSLSPTQNTYTSQYVQECVGLVPLSGATIAIGLFTMRDDTFNSTPLQGTERETVNLAGASPNIDILIVEQGAPASIAPVINNSTTSTLALSFVGDLLLQVESSDQLASIGNVADSSMQCFYLIVSGGLYLTSQPGFSDQPDSALASGTFSLGLELAKINQNAAFGMVRMEFFQGIYQNGDTVTLPISSVDGYEYQQSEVTYLWTVYSSCNPSNGWITGPSALWYAEWFVDQDTGIVTCQEWYRNDAQSGVSNDGFLQVFTIGQRQQSSLALTQSPSWWDTLVASDFTTDAPQSTGLMVSLNDNSKFSVVGAEVIYCGEFYNGETVSFPSSPIDGWQYTESEVQFMFSWRWTTTQGQYTAPAWGTDWSFDGMYATVSSAGAVVCKISWGGRGGEGCSSDTTSGRIAVFAFCQRIPRWVIPPSASWIWVSGGENSSYLGGSAPGTPVMIIPTIAGDTYTLDYVSGLITAATGPWGPLGDTVDGPAGSGFPLTGNNKYCAVGCFTDAGGNIVTGGTPFAIGLTNSLTAPTGSAQLQIGMNGYSSAYTGSWTFSLARQTNIAKANQFAEIADNLFYPGQLMYATLARQLFQNIQEASLSPEFFGPTAYTPTETVPLPTSPIDGYEYKRSELMYLWTWQQCNTNSSFDSSNNNRIALFSGSIDQATGVVATNFYRLEPGGPYQEQTNSDGTLMVLTLGFRTSQQAAISAPNVNNPPSDAGSQTDSPGGSVLVNGVIVVG